MPDYKAIVPFVPVVSLAAAALLAFGGLNARVNATAETVRTLEPRAEVDAKFGIVLQHLDRLDGKMDTLLSR